MNAIPILPLLFLLPCLASAALPDDVRMHQRTLRTASDLLRAGSTAGALSHLQQNIRPEPGPGGDQTALPQSLIEIACEFYNRRELHLARAAILQARQAAAPVLAGNTPATAQRRAHLYTSLGLLYETVLFDLGNAIACYDAALVLQPTDALSRARRANAVEKQTRRPGGAR